MGAEEREVGQLVGKAGRVESGDVGLPAVVLGVTAAALTFAGLGHTAVIAGLCADVRGNFLVTVQAKTGLALAAGTVMANRTVILELRVRL